MGFGPFSSQLCLVFWRSVNHCKKILWVWTFFYKAVLENTNVALFALLNSYVGIIRYGNEHIPQQYLHNLCGKSCKHLSFSRNAIKMNVEVRNME